MYNEPDPDRPHDPARSAADALTELGHAPGRDPVTQLRHVTSDLMARAHQAHTAYANQPSGAAALTLTAVQEQAIIALVSLAETQLDDIEQEALAAAFGLDGPGDAA